MKKFYELTDKNSCLNKADNNEMLFVLLGRDAAAPFAIKAWIDKRIELGKNKETDEQIKEAYLCIEVMQKRIS